MSASTPKRVSFGSHKSMVETIIIDIDGDLIPPDERTFFHQRNRSHLRTSQSSTAAELSHARLDGSSLSRRRTGSEDKIESDNPFTANSELRRKADYILRHSRISRTDLHIVDPDSSKTTEEMLHPRAAEFQRNRKSTVDKAETEEVDMNGCRSEAKRHSSKENKDFNGEERNISDILNGRENHMNIQESVKVSEMEKVPGSNHDLPQQTTTTTVQEVYCSKICSPVFTVGSVDAMTSPELQRAEQVKLKSGGISKCCKVQ